MAIEPVPLSSLQNLNSERPANPGSAAATNQQPAVSEQQSGTADRSRISIPATTSSDSAVADSAVTLAPATTVDRTATDRIFPPAQLDQALQRLEQTLSQNTEAALTSQTRAPGTYLSILV